ncbi:MAG TPA: sulfatase [Vicinamibacteria bacterium]|nr:sulfatase [Vicinamibacteria bacterium]
MSSPRLRAATGPALLLGGVLVASKLAILGWPEHARWPLDLLACSWQDVLLAAGFGIAVAALPRARSGRASGAALGAGALLALWGPANVGFFGYFRRPFNLHMLDLVGHAPALSSSFAEHVTWKCALALVAAPVLVTAGSLLLQRRHDVHSRSRPMAAAIVACLWVGIGGPSYAAYEKNAPERRMAESPHLALAVSAYERLSGRRTLVLPRDFPPDDLADHQPFGERRREPSTLDPAAPRPRNVILIVLESTSARWLSLYGSPFDTWPRLSEEARHALVVDHAYSHEGYTFCSLMSLAFSDYPGLPWRWRPGGDAPLPPTLAQLVRARGYRTAYVHSGDLEWEGMGYMMEKAGFETILGAHDLGGPMLSSWGTRDRSLFDAVLRFIDSPERAGRPFFVMGWTDQSHDPYVLSPDAAPRDFVLGRDGQAGFNRYLNVLREVDGAIGDLLDGLRRRGLADDTLVVVTGDHGEAFGAPHDVEGHGAALYEENVHVPLVVWSPRLFGDRGRRTGDVASHVDVGPTIADVLGLEPPAAWEGESLFARARANRAYFETGCDDYQFGLREGPWKYIYGATTGTEQLFHLPDDPDEQHDLSADRPEVARRMRQRVAAFIAAEERHLDGERVRR